jgi:hypothetical protein
MGAEADIIAYLTGRHFGLRAFGETMDTALSLMFWWARWVRC